MTTHHGAGHPAPLLTPTEARLIEAGISRGPQTIARALSDGEAATLAAETRAAIRAHRQETTDMKWGDIDRNYVQPLEGRITARLVPVRVPVQTFGRTAVRSPYAAPPRERPWWRVTTALLLIAGAVLVIGGTELLRAAWAAWGGAR